MTVPSVGITPACAGKRHLLPRRSCRAGNYPRLRGEEDKRIDHSAGLAELPPLARGREQARLIQFRRAGITPACAGKRRILRPQRALGGNYPRLRGEEQPAPAGSSYYRELPPLARGRVNTADKSTLRVGITPACAGKRRDSRGCGYKEWNYPRLRGEEIFAALVSMLLRELPPLARGRVRGRATKRRAKGITPACAGKRRRRHRGHARARNYPRLRGEELAA